MSSTSVIFTPAVSPDTPEARWRGFRPGRSVLRAGTTHSPGGRPLGTDIILDRDTVITLRDGTVVYGDVFRPADGEQVPAILAWSPYGKQGGHLRFEIFPGRAGLAPEAVSGLEKFEGPDPAFWCAAGYVVINIDPRGSYESDGDIQSWSEQEARDGYDVIEWAAAQDWCDGAVVMAGNSWLAVMQWRIAALRPPHLAAIAPWEGFTDAYRDFSARGGIPDLSFARDLMDYNAGRHKIENLVEMIQAHPLMDDYWRSKIADIEAISVPVYAVSSWTNPLHPRGTLDAIQRLDPGRSWLRVHNNHEWRDQYSHEQELLAFFDHVVKKADNGWEATPRIRLSILDPGGTDTVDRPESEWPPAGTRQVPFFLDAASASLSRSAVGDAGSVSYACPDGAAEFTLTFEQDAEIAGPMKLRVWVEAIGSDDADLFVFVQKRDPSGRPLLAQYMPTVPVTGAKGQLRASHRDLDAAASTPLVPVHPHTAEQRLRPGEIVPLDIPIWPLGMRWHAGQQLCLIISSRDLAAPHHPDTPPNPTRNVGEHRLYSGGEYDSHLLVPLVS